VREAKSETAGSKGTISCLYHLREPTMRLVVDLPEVELERLNALSRERRVSRAELIRRAVSGYLEQSRTGLEETFGIWKKKGVDGARYQERLRGEWGR
jgi:hypothetical protein